LPKEEYDLILVVKDQRVGNDRELPTFQEYLEAVVTDSHGKEICNGRGILATNQDGRAWTLSSDPVQPAFWNSKCLAIHIEPVESYTLAIGVSESDPRSEGVFVMPVVKGGGIELP